MPELDDIFTPDERQAMQKDASMQRQYERARAHYRGELAELIGIKDDPDEWRKWRQDIQALRDSRAYWEGIRKQSIGGVLIALATALATWFASQIPHGSR